MISLRLTAAGPCLRKAQRRPVVAARAKESSNKDETVLAASLDQPAMPDMSFPRKGLSRDVVNMFQDAQKNILELNRSRLQAIDDLKAANARIEELEAKVAELEEVVEKGGGAPGEEPKPTDTIEVLYESGWPDAWIHYNVEGRGWTKPPGDKMATGGNDSIPHAKRVVFDAKSVEFVMNNGGDKWDSPDPFNKDGPKNYTVDSPGTYRLKSGKLHKME
ncbi:unnamed protein product [Pedinophyceae sp. YPF-701]|nr:unnamed protein product [Pedinophyceae sp. YPF-701]